MHRDIGPPEGSGLQSTRSGRTVAEASQKVVSKRAVVGHLLVSEIVLIIQEVVGTATMVSRGFRCSGQLLSRRAATEGSPAF